MPVERRMLMHTCINLFKTWMIFNKLLSQTPSCFSLCLPLIISYPMLISYIQLTHLSVQVSVYKQSMEAHTIIYDVSNVWVLLCACVLVYCVWQWLIKQALVCISAYETVTGPPFFKTSYYQRCAHIGLICCVFQHITKYKSSLKFLKDTP